MKLLLVVGALAGASACRGESADPPDGAPADAEFLFGDFSCRDEAWPTTADDPLTIYGLVMDGGGEVGGASVEIRATADDTVLATATSSDQAADRGEYTAELVTGGVAPEIYRFITADGYLDTLAWDAFPIFTDYRLNSFLQTMADAEAVHAEAGVAVDPTKGAIAVRILDCGLPGPIPGSPVIPVTGATVDGPAGATVIYAGETDLADADLTATGSTGLAIVLGVEPGMVDITVHAGPVTYRPRPVQVVAGSVTFSMRHP